MIAGKTSLDRRVRWVHISDYVDIAESLHGGELLLTSGKALEGDRGVQVRFIEDMARAEVAALVLEAGEAFQEVPKVLAEAAERAGLVLILLRVPTPYVDITEQVHTILINSNYEALQESQRVQEDLTELVLEGARPRQLVGRLGQLFRNPVFLEDPAHHLIEYAAYRENVDAIVADWASHSRQGHAEAAGSARAPDEEARCEWTQINALGQTWGRLHVVEVDTEFGEMTPLLLNLGAATLGLSLVADRQASDWVEQARSSLVDDIVRGTHESEEELVRRGLQLGVRLDSRELMALVAQAVPANGGGAAAATDGPASVLLGVVRKVLSESKATAICARQGRRVLVLGAPPVLQSGDSKDLARSLATEILARATPRLEGEAIAIGTCVDSDATSLRKTVDRATIALGCGLTKGQGSGIYDFAELGFEEILFRMSASPELSLIVEAEIGALLALDAAERGDLTETLRVVLSSPSISQAARALHIERRSLYHRLKRIKQILGCDLNDPQTHVRLMFALEAHAFVQRRDELALHGIAHDDTN